MRVSLLDVTVITPPAGALVTPAEAQAFARAPVGLEDDSWSGWIATAVQLAQEWTARQFLQATFEGCLKRFPCAGESIVLLPAPLVEVVSVQYVDADLVVQTLAAEEYEVHAPAGPTAAPGSVWASTWPSTGRHPRAVRVRFQAGYGTTAPEVWAVVPTLQHAVLKGAAEAYARREQDDILRAMLPELQALQAAL